MRPPRKGISLSAALAAAYASAPEEDVLLDTLEFRHPSFIDGSGATIALRVVNDHEALTATLEDDAPMNAGEEVEFLPVRFTFRRPNETDGTAPPEIQVNVDNVARILGPYIDQAKETRVPIEMTWRPYLTSDLSGPHILPVLTLVLRNVSTDLNQLSARAGFGDIGNRRFPASEYTARKFYGLAAR